MSKLTIHEKKDNVKWWFAGIAIVLILAVLAWLIVAAVKDVNAVCLFKHDYGEDNKCIRCGADKPIENGDEQPQAVIAEKYVFASADMLNSGETYSAASVTDVDDVNNVGLSSGGYRFSHSVTDSVKQYSGQNPEGIVELNFNELGGFCINECAVVSAPVKVVSDHLYVGIRSMIVNSCDVVYSVNGKDWSYVTVNYANGASTYLEITEPGTYKFVLVKDGARYSKVISVTFVKTDPLPTPPVKTGYTFTGWYTDEACTNKYTASTVTGNITLYAGFRANTYEIRFDANGGSGSMANEAMTYDKSKALTANAFTKEHYAFQGWSTYPNGNIAYSNSASVKNLTADDGAVITLFAVWERAEVSVTFVSEGTTVSTVWVAIGSAVTLPDMTPEKEGHLFIGWYYNDGEYNNQPVSEDITLTAKFDIIRCKITFIVDGEVYAVYVCDWGTKLSEALSKNVNPVLLKTEDEYSRNF